eukprot:jgi/Botrbrau1/15068/Bobra.0286s0001.1
MMRLSYQLNGIKLQKNIDLMEGSSRDYSTPLFPDDNENRFDRCFSDDTANSKLSSRSASVGVRSDSVFRSQLAGMPSCSPSSSTPFGPLAKAVRGGWGSGNAASMQSPSLETPIQSLHSTGRQSCQSSTYDCVTRDGTLILSVAWKQQKRLDIQQVKHLTVASFRSLLQVYVGMLQCGLAEGGMSDSPPRQCSDNTALLADLVREATALGTYVGICNPAMMQEYHRAPVQKRNNVSLKTAPWSDVLEAIQLTADQAHALLSQFRHFQSRTCQIYLQWEMALKNAQACCGNWATSIDSFSNLNDMHDKLAALLSRIDLEKQSLSQFTSEAVKVLTPEQAAVAFIESFPWYPDMLAIAELLSTKYQAGLAEGHLEGDPSSSPGRKAHSGSGPPDPSTSRGKEAGSPLGLEEGHVRCTSLPNNLFAPTDMLQTPENAPQQSIPPAYPPRGPEAGVRRSSQELRGPRTSSFHLNPAPTTGRSSSAFGLSHASSSPFAPNRGGTLQAEQVIGRSSPLPRRPPANRGSVAANQHGGPGHFAAYLASSSLHGPEKERAECEAPESSSSTPSTRQHEHNEWVGQQVSRAQQASIRLAHALADLEGNKPFKSDLPAPPSPFQYVKSMPRMTQTPPPVSLQPPLDELTPLKVTKRSGSLDSKVSMEAVRAFVASHRQPQFARMGSVDMGAGRLADLDRRPSLAEGSLSGFHPREPVPTDQASGETGVETAKKELIPVQLLHWQGAAQSPWEGAAASQTTQPAAVDTGHGAVPEGEYKFKGLHEETRGFKSSTDVSQRRSISGDSLMNLPLGKRSPGSHATAMGMASLQSPMSRFSQDQKDAATGASNWASLGVKNILQSKSLNPPKEQSEQAGGTLKPFLSWTQQGSLCEDEEANSMEQARSQRRSFAGLQPPLKAANIQEPLVSAASSPLPEAIQAMPEPAALGQLVSGFAPLSATPLPVKTTPSSPAVSLSESEVWNHVEEDLGDHYLRSVQSEILVPGGLGPLLRKRHSRSESPHPHSATSQKGLSPRHTGLAAHMSNQVAKQVSALSQAISKYDHPAQEWSRMAGRFAPMSRGTDFLKFGPVAPAGEVVSGPQMHPIGTIRSLAAGVLTKNAPHEQKASAKDEQ